MAIKTYKPTTPSRRHMTVSAFEGIDKKAKPERSLLESLKKHAGRNSYGLAFLSMPSKADTVKIGRASCRERVSSPV